MENPEEGMEAYPEGYIDQKLDEARGIFNTNRGLRLRGTTLASMLDAPARVIIYCIKKLEKEGHIEPLEQDLFSTFWIRKKVMVSGDIVEGAIGAGGILPDDAPQEERNFEYTWDDPQLEMKLMGINMSDRDIETIRSMRNDPAETSKKLVLLAWATRLTMATQITIRPKKVE